jgi:hypothetical protein
MLIRVLASVHFFSVLMGSGTEQYQSVLPPQVDATVTHKQLHGDFR